MSNTLLALEYGNVFVALLALAAPAHILIQVLWWQTGTLAGLLGIFLTLLFLLETKLQEATFSHVDGTKFRSSATPGCWCCLLLPFINLSCWLETKSTPSEASVRMMLVSLGLLGAALLWMQALVWKTSVCPAKASYVLMKQTFWQVTVLALVVGLAMVHLWQISVVFALVTSLACHSLFCVLVFALPKAFPSSFTIGEMIIWAQGGSLFVIAAIEDLTMAVVRGGPVQQSVASTLVAKVVLMSCFLVIFLLLSVPFLRRPLSFYSLWMGTAVFVMLPLMILLLKENPVTWLIGFLLASEIRIFLLLCWILLIFLATMVVVYQQFREKQASTVTRKLFHLLILFVYIPGLLWDAELLYLASLLTLAVFVILESMRVLQIPPLGISLNNSLHIFLDEKDAGLLILTPLYLLLGCSLPIWLDPCRTIGLSLASWSGLLSLGFGDTVASITGVTLGSHHWPQSKKTLEGTGVSILVQLVVLAFLGSEGWTVQPPSLRSSLVVVTSSLMEAFTSQVDNLVVPLWTFLMFLSV